MKARSPSKTVKTCSGLSDGAPRGFYPSSGSLTTTAGGNSAVETQFNDARNAVRTLRSGGANSLSSGNFEDALNSVDSAISDVNSARGTIGAYQKNTLRPQLRSNEVAITNLMDTRSRLSDTDFGQEISNLNRSKILVEAGVKVLKIAQSQTRSILDLFG